MLNSYIGITDFAWFELLRQQPQLDEVNFWQPGGTRQFRALSPGDLFLFKLHSPRDYIVGGGLFAHSSLMPISLAWSAFGRSNGVSSLAEMRARTLHYRRTGADEREDFTVGCILLTQPFFLPEERWIPVPDDWKPNIVQGRGYDLSVGPGLTLYRQLQAAMSSLGVLEADSPRFGEGILVRPRLGQGTFRVIVTDAYERRCAISGERVLPVLEAAHVRPYSEGGQHRIDNGLLLRSDLHTLFDAGYMTITPDLHVVVSKKLREEFENGREYYALSGHPVRRPTGTYGMISTENIRWHNENRYFGT
ncbi:MAG: HNH endonuclease signature motif containing protein [Steroidobacteraceae bacterium]